MQIITNEITNNQVELLGKVEKKGLIFSHEVFGEKFYEFDIELRRLSQNKDIIPILVSEKVPNIFNIKKGKIVHLKGQYRSFNKFENEKSKLILNVFAREITFMEEQELDTNEIFLQGFICEPVIYRKTPLGREISDMMIAVNRSYAKCDYIPCIIWNKNARKVANYKVGTGIRLYGRIQSREYPKKLLTGKVELRTAYEVSASKIEKV